MTPTKKQRPRRNICPRCDQPTGKASAKHTCPPKATRTSTRTSRPVTPGLQLTDRMKARGISDRVRDTRVLCTRCGCATWQTNGTTRWCPSCDFV